MDPQGRIKIPQNLADYAGINKDIVLVGVSERIEIWDKVKWEEYYNRAESRFMGDDATFEGLDF
jgi:MraZ protein